jgi:hypothetical protein
MERFNLKKLNEVDIKIANRSFENLSQLRYLGMTVTIINLVQDEIK